MYTPGDNEWTDCHRPNNGAYDPLERLNTGVRETFFATPGVRWAADEAGARAVVVPRERPVDAIPTVFAAVTAREPAADAGAGERAAARIAAAMGWIDEAFDTAEAWNARGLVLMIRATPSRVQT